MKTAFIRHNNFGQHIKVLQYLWDNRIIALHYADKKSTIPDDYGPSGRRALKLLRGYCENGANIAATYSDLYPDKMLVGKIEKGSEIKPLECKEISKEVSWIFKVVSIEDTQVVSINDYPILSAIQPRYSTLSGWPSAEKHIAAILGHKSLDWDVSSLTPAQLEVICYEYLRMEGTLKTLLLPIGRTLTDADIVGLGENGVSVVAQVTHSNDNKVIADKIAHLKNFATGETKLIFFGPKTQQIQDPDIRYIAIEDVFSTLTSDVKSMYYLMISQMLMVK